MSNNDSKYIPNDCSVGDVDGDGEYEIFVKWDPAGSMPFKDNSQSGKTGNVIIDCYKLNGTRLWSVNLGPNIRAGAHYTQFLVYDFDGDGKAEMICKTAPGSRDGRGIFVTKAADDADIKNVNNNQSFRNSKGYILSGPEYLTVFNGQNGRAVNTIFYRPNRAGGVGGSADMPVKSFWGDNYGNRCDRFNATVAYLAGANKNPSAVFERGYYTRNYLWAVDYSGGKLQTRWLSASISANEVDVTKADGQVRKYTRKTSTSGSGSCTAYGNGNHNLSCADVDGDGRDEIILGASAIDDDGKVMYATGYGHGDAMHLGDLMPDHDGLEVFSVHEAKPYGWDIHDAKTGKILASATGSADNGRGMAADIVANSRGYEYWSANDRTIRNAASGSKVGEKDMSMNFRIYWDGTLQDNLFDGRLNTKTGKYSPEITAMSADGKTVSWLNVNGQWFDKGKLGSPQACNYTKETPCLQADLFGDWREELVMWDGDNPAQLDIYMSTYPTEYRVPTLMHDHTYRMGITWQQSAYNQPPHLGYYLPDYAIKDTVSTAITQPTTDEGSDKVATTWTLQGAPQSGNQGRGIVIRNGKKYINP